MPGTSLPVTLVSGVPGAGKTAMIDHVLCAGTGRGASVTTDGCGKPVAHEIVSTGAGFDVRRMEPDWPVVGGGDRRAARRAIVEAVAALAGLGHLDYLILEARGLVEPMPMAAALDGDLADGTRLDRPARLDTLVTVLDASTFLADMAQGERTLTRTAVADGPNVADVLLGQVEFADVILLNKTDLVDVDVQRAVVARVRCLNPVARLVVTADGVVDANDVVGTGLFDAAAARRFPGWWTEITGTEPTHPVFDHMATDIAGRVLPGQSRRRD